MAGGRTRLPAIYPADGWIEMKHIIGLMHDRLRATAFPAGMARWSPLAPRLIVGLGFMEHGVAKLARGSEHFVTILQGIGVPAAHPMAWATILIEVLGGFAILTGSFVTLVSIPMAVVLLVAVFTVHLPNGFSSIKLLAVTPSGAQFGQPGYETDLLYLACLVALVLGGPGPLAVDGVLRSRSKRRARLPARG